MTALRLHYDWGLQEKDIHIERKFHLCKKAGELADQWLVDLGHVSEVLRSVTQMGWDSSIGTWCWGQNAYVAAPLEGRTPKNFIKLQWGFHRLQPQPSWEQEWMYRQTLLSVYDIPEDLDLLGLYLQLMNPMFNLFAEMCAYMARFEKSGALVLRAGGPDLRAERTYVPNSNFLTYPNFQGER